MIVFCGILWNYCFFSELFITESWKLQIWQIRAVSLNWKYKKIADLASTFISLPHKKQNSKFYVWINTLFYTRAFLLQASLNFFFFLLDFHLYICFDAKIDFPGGSDGKASAYNVGFNPWVGKISWRRKWQPTPVLLPGKSHGQRSLVGCSPWGHKSQTWLRDFTFFHFLILK